MTDPRSFETISVSDLVVGMYVVAITDSENLEIKSEGYVNSANTIRQLQRAKIKQVCVDPSRQKKVENIDRVLSDIPSLKEKQQANRPKVERTLDQEMKQASKLYNDAKALQAKIMGSVKLEKALKIDNISETTNAMVDSVFRNSDALSCLTRMQSKDSYLLEHSLNVAILMAVFAKHLGFEKRQIQEMFLGAFLHDLGKVLIPDEILHKPGALTDKEYKIMQSHVALGLKMLEDSPEISHIAMRMVREHHERNDGRGYPKGLTKEDISKYGHMIAIVDSYDAMTSDRVYQKGMTPIKAFKILVSESPASFDEELVEKFIQCLGVYPVGTLVKLNSGKLGLISKLNPQRPLHPYVKVFYSTRMNQAIPIEEINLAQSKYRDQIDCCIKPEEFNINLLGFFHAAFIN
ncbi:HD-GYP domain-containing protein [Thalassotalea marina]|uniref:Phosphodiesterase n=1 Tax=Thalassotalea marina TaxID=1673741 RepID=A0A919BEC6_9GAMM|nr:HD-GYP domain-containing protein [Thalassotalea marina]GHF85079.1 phosphodiesterase [Thalassotalea marina]